MISPQVWAQCASILPAHLGNRGHLHTDVADMQRRFLGGAALGGEMVVQAAPVVVDAIALLDVAEHKVHRPGGCWEGYCGLEVVALLGGSHLDGANRALVGPPVETSLQSQGTTSSVLYTRGGLTSPTNTATHPLAFRCSACQGGGGGGGHSKNPRTLHLQVNLLAAGKIGVLRVVVQGDILPGGRRGGLSEQHVAQLQMLPAEVFPQAQVLEYQSQKSPGQRARSHAHVPRSPLATRPTEINCQQQHSTAPHLAASNLL